MTVKEKTFELVTGAVAANRPRAKDPRPAVLALLHHELAGFGAVPEGLIDGSDLREGFANFFFGHSKKPFVFRVRGACSWGGNHDHEHALHGIS